MKRREFITKSGAAAAGVATAAIAAPAIFPRSHTVAINYNLAEEFAGTWNNCPIFCGFSPRLVSDGRLEVKLFASGEVVPAFESIDAVSAGTVEMGHGAPYYWKGKAVASQLVSNFPFGLTAQEYNAWIQFGGGAELCDEFYQDALGCRVPYLW